MQKMFPSLWDDSFLSLTKPKVTNLIKKYLETNIGVDEINRNWGECENLKKKKESDSEEAKAQVFLSCGNKIVDGERFRHNMELESDSDED